MLANPNGCQNELDSELKGHEYLGGLTKSIFIYSPTKISCYLFINLSFIISKKRKSLNSLNE